MILQCVSQRSDAVDRVRISWYSEVGCVVGWVGFCCTGLIQLCISDMHPHSQVQSLCFCVSLCL